MKWVNMYLIGYLIFLAGVVAALWKSGILDRIGGTWTLIGLVIAAGLGIMVAVSSAGGRGDINIRK